MRIVLLVAIVFVVASVCQANLITNSGFEQTETTFAYPDQYGDWSGDRTAIVGTSGDVTPYEGSKMLKFRYTGWGAYAQDSIASDLYQLVDISAYSSLIASGNAVVNASAYFNRVAYDNETDTEFKIRIIALTGAPSGFHPLGNVLAVFSEYFATDENSSTWEKFETELSLPDNTSYVAICISAMENIHNDMSGVEFDGHYADCVSLEVVPEPTTISLIALGCALIRRRNK